MPATLAPARPDVGRVHPDNASARNSAPPERFPAASSPPAAKHARTNRLATDDEILGLTASSGEDRRHSVESRSAVDRGDEESLFAADAPEDEQSKRDPSSGTPRRIQDDDPSREAEPENLRGILKANPDLRRAGRTFTRRARSRTRPPRHRANGHRKTDRALCPPRAGQAAPPQALQPSSPRRLFVRTFPRIRAGQLHCVVTERMIFKDRWALIGLPFASRA
jgi:hypothetical protein